jgi:ABC-type molybdate transport system ATPase subunit
VLFDEPLANLDPVRKAELLAVFRALLRDRKTPAVYVTHDLREVAGLADRLAVLEVSASTAATSAGRCPRTTP